MLEFTLSGYYLRRSYLKFSVTNVGISPSLWHLQDLSVLVAV